MEKPENDIIRLKLEELDKLPEGYNPSLESKFDLLITGIEKPARKKMLWWPQVAAAACLLLASLWWMNNDDKEKYALSNSPVETKLPAQKTEATVGHQVVTTHAAPAKIQAAIRHQAKQKNNVIAPGQSTKAEQNIEPALPLAQNTTMPVNNISVADTTMPAVAQAKPASKKRYTEFDFNDALQNPATETNNEMAATKPRFRIGLSSVAENNNVPVVKKPLRLQQTF